ncbi:MAG TPA: dienelactone hydrolase family protein [Burkholderiales bacterium]|jgi:dienelactone hydrolase|nr:dienelactone hydrolase family protein [Burkholderiales bacterium]
MKSIVHAISTAAIAVAPALGLAQIVRVEVHPVQSVTMSDQDFLNGRKDAKPVTLAGQLKIPRAGSERLPAVVLLHGSGGVGGNVVDWENDFNQMGIATFVLDAFTGRGITSTSANQASLGRLAMTYDAYRALEVLEKHPRIDSRRVALIGFSRGGQAALYAASKRFQRMHGPASGLDFAAYVPFYASCGTQFVDDENMSPKPIRMFHGAADNYVPVAPCREYVKRLKAKGADVALTEYPGAHHAFDSRLLKTPVVAEKSQSTRSCQLAERQNGVIVNVKTGQAFTYADPCVELGPTVAYDEKGHAAAQKAVKEFFAATLLAP